ncbi:Katanin p60 ATPase-containing subunit A1 [Trifolium repens]|nr:Katanin p60 ATPase-containing subunit A1 [Trifolium repens]
MFLVDLVHYESKEDASTKIEFITFISQFAMLKMGSQIGDVLETSPGVRWYDVASLTEAKRLLGEAIVLEYSLYGCMNISRASGEHESSKRVKSELLVQVYCLGFYSLAILYVMLFIV